jgi:hypothetical protein
MYSSILTSALFSGLVAAQQWGSTWNQPSGQRDGYPNQQWGPPRQQSGGQLGGQFGGQFGGRPGGQPGGRPGGQPKQPDDSTLQPAGVPLRVPIKQDITPQTRWCPIYPYDARNDYTIACNWGNHLAIIESPQTTLLNLHAITFGESDYNECNAYLPFQCKRREVDAT